MTDKYKPTMLLSWREATSEQEEGPCASTQRYYEEYGPTSYVLTQWWTDGEKGEWRVVPVRWNDAPPEPLEV